MKLDYVVFDADNHYFEPRNVFTDYIDPDKRHLALQPVSDARGVERLYSGEIPSDRVALEWKMFDEVPLPGALHANMKLVASGQASGEVHYATMEPIRPEYLDRDARLELMDRQGLAGAVLFPSLGVMWEHQVRDSVELTYANMRAFNRWLAEAWGYQYVGRLFAVPLLSLLDREKAIEELEMVLAAGARAIHLRPGPQGRRSPADPYFDPFWARVDEANAVVFFHQSRTDYFDSVSDMWSDSEPVGSRSAFKHFQTFGDRPIMDTMAALVLHNFFGRFPRIRVAVIEHGAAWVRYLLSGMAHAAAFSIDDLWIGGRPEQRPREVFKRHVWVAPYPEEKVEPLVEIMGADHVLFGSDYPHAEGLADPVAYADRLGGLSGEDRAKIMGGNIMSLLDVARPGN